MDEFSAPSFSLGFDDDDTPIPPYSAIAGDPQAPSFSLGFDLAPPPPPAANELEDFDEDPSPETLDPDLAGVAENPPALKRLRRGGGPSAGRSHWAGGGGEGVSVFGELPSADDDIEEFSSQEEWRDRDGYTPLPNHVACSSSKFSLHSRGLMIRPATKLKDSKILPSSIASISTIIGASSNKKMKDSKISPSSIASSSTNIGAGSNNTLFPKLTISPLRKFCLVDSDSDDPSSSRDMSKDTKEVNASLKKRQFTSSQPATRNEERTTFPYNNVQTESFWKDHVPKENINLETPVLDEFCEEYFRSTKERNINQHMEEDTSFISSRVLDPDDFMDDFQGYDKPRRVTRKPTHNWNLSHPQPPAYQYFYHDDVRIQALVRDRFRYFVPLGAEEHRGNQQSMTENLDYMGQFGTRQIPNRANGNLRSTTENLDYMSPFGTRQAPSQSEGSSRKRGRKPKTNIAKEPSPTEGWVNPKSNITIPKDAGKRRVSAVGNQSGHWFTGEDGRKFSKSWDASSNPSLCASCLPLKYNVYVYVTKNGQELTGRVAYSHYKKEDELAVLKVRADT